MKIQSLAKLKKGQDGAIWGNYLVRFLPNGEGTVYDLSTLPSDGGEAEEIASVTLDRASELCPHSNAVVFGCEYYAPEDEFPLLYSNLYNNYAKTDRPRKGVCCVYRLQRVGSTFKTTLVQLIEIGFVEDPTLWKLDAGKDGVRPYGNFVIDREKALYYGFVMLDEARGTRYFSFDLPRLTDGTPDPELGVNKVVLGADAIRSSFDCPYHYYLQGACCYGGKIYSTEGFTDNQTNQPGIRVIDPAAGKQLLYVNLLERGIRVEPEMIDFYGNACYYSDAHGTLFHVEFDELT